MDKLKFLSIRATNFEKYEGAGGASNVESVDFGPIYNGLNKDNLATFVKQEISVGDKPELTSAKIVSARMIVISDESDFYEVSIS